MPHLLGRAIPSSEKTAREQTSGVGYWARHSRHLLSDDDHWTRLSGERRGVLPSEGAGQGGAPIGPASLSSGLSDHSATPTRSLKRRRRDKTGEREKHSQRGGDRGIFCIFVAVFRIYCWETPLSCQVKPLESRDACGGEFIPIKPCHRTHQIHRRSNPKMVHVRFDDLIRVPS
jgi:hypothetical protein